MRRRLYTLAMASRDVGDKCVFRWNPRNTVCWHMAVSTGRHGVSEHQGWVTQLSRSVCPGSHMAQLQGICTGTLSSTAVWLEMLQNDGTLPQLAYTIYCMVCFHHQWVVTFPSWGFQSHIGSLLWKDSCWKQGSMGNWCSWRLLVCGGVEKVSEWETARNGGSLPHLISISLSRGS